MRIALSKKHKLPCLKIGNSPALTPRQIIYWLFERKFKYKTVGEITHFYDDNFHFLTKRINYIREMQHWSQDYALPENKKIEKIFDIGCDYGSSLLFFYLNHGIKRFSICDVNKEMIDYCYINARLNGWNIENGFTRPFCAEMLNWADYDLVKIDVEGGEKELLKLREIDFPIIVEVHSHRLKNELTNKFGFTVRKVKSIKKGLVFDGLYMMDNFKWLGLE